MIVEWMCPHCMGEYKSDSNIRYKTDVCSCSKSGVDADMFYYRVLGDAFIKHKGFVDEQYKKILKYG